MASYRGFQLDRDSMGLLSAQVLVPGEQVRWVSDAGIGHYMVRDRESDGTETDYLRRSFSIFLKIVFFPVYLFYLVLKDQFFGGASEKPAPDTVVFGKRIDCAAVYDRRTPRVRPGRGLWVLTDRRFLRVKLDRRFQWGEREAVIDEAATALPLEPITCEIRFVVDQRDFVYEPEVRLLLRKGSFKPQRPKYRRIVLSDGSGFALSPAAITGLS